jgi:hypothetical protein
VKTNSIPHKLKLKSGVDFLASWVYYFYYENFILTFRRYYNWFSCNYASKLPLIFIIASLIAIFGTLCGKETNIPKHIRPTFEEAKYYLA